MRRDNVIIVYDWDNDETLMHMTDSKEHQERINQRRREHRREKRLRRAGDVAFICVLCACFFIIGMCVGSF